MKKGGRQVVNKKRMDSTKIRYNPSTFKRSSRKCQHKENGSKMNGYKLKKKIKTKDATKGEVPKATCFILIGKTLSKNFGTYKLKCGFDPSTQCLKYVFQNYF